MGATTYELPVWESVELLGGETVGRLCVIEKGCPMAFPLNYRLVREVDRTRIVFRAVAHAAVARYEGPASLEVDHIGATTAWSVIACGMLHRVIGQHDLPDTNPRVDLNRHQWVVLDVTSISGRRFVSKPSADGFGVDWQTSN